MDHKLKIKGVKGHDKYFHLMGHEGYGKLFKLDRCKPRTRGDNVVHWRPELDQSELHIIMEQQNSECRVGNNIQSTCIISENRCTRCQRHKS